MPTRITRKALVKAGHEVIGLLKQYKLRSEWGERKADRVVLGFLQGRFGNVTRQHAVQIGKRGVNRIDFRQGGPRPVLIEFAVATSNRATIKGPQNRSELVKLERHPPSQASARYLLLLDLGKEPVHKTTLRRSYDHVKGGRGRYKRYPVKVIYVHIDRERSFSFPWCPVESA